MIRFALCFSTILLVALSQCPIALAQATNLGFIGAGGDVGSDGGGTVLGQCDPVLITCAAAAADAGSACFVAYGGVGALDVDMTVCAAYGVAAEGSFSHLILASGEAGTAMVTSHTSNGTLQKDLRECGETHGGDLKSLENLLQYNICMKDSHAVGGAICHDAEAAANAFTAGFSSQVPGLSASSCEGKSILDSLQASPSSTDELPSSVAAGIKHALEQEFESHILQIRAEVGGAPELKDLEEALVQQMSQGFETDLNGPIGVWVLSAQ